jgi:FtsP/CotA-like multicopper oxidase with cupredoxin domain
MISLTRRRLLHLGTGALATGALAGRIGVSEALAGGPVTLRASSRTLDVHGKPARVFGLAQANGVAGLFAEEVGNRFRVSLANDLETETLIHWHGLTPPSEQDGVPGLSQPALAAGQTYDYDFVHNRAGTFWMHSHLGLQEQQLLAAPLVVRDPAEAGSDEQEVVLLLHDFSFRTPEEIFAELRRDAGMEMPMPDGGGQAEAEPHGGMTMGGSMEMGEGHDGDMPMGETMAMGKDPGGGQGGGMVHFNDVEYDAYLANDRSLADPEVVRVEPGGRVRLRIINAAAATNFIMDLGALEGELIAVDGNPIEPMRTQKFDLAIAQRADVRLTLPASQGAYPVLALREDGRERTGVVLATKTARISRLSEQGESKSRPLDLGLERRLSAVSALPERHPIHLHGHHFQVVAIDDERFSGAVRDTVLVPPERSVTIAFDADNPGHWAFHCHQLYHMAAGMMTSVRYEGYKPA